jgi:hypothetical protein
MSVDDTIVENAKRAMRDYSKKDEKIWHMMSILRTKIS